MALSCTFEHVVIVVCNLFWVEEYRSAMQRTTQTVRLATVGILMTKLWDVCEFENSEETKTAADLQGISPTIWEVLDSSERLAKQRSSAIVTSQVDSSFIDFLQDDPRTMTYSRRLALFLLRRYAWYNPHLKPPPPSDNKDENTYEPELPKQRSNVVLIDSYPFTHSKRERPSLEKAWA